MENGILELNGKKYHLIPVEESDPYYEAYQDVRYKMDGLRDTGVTVVFVKDSAGRTYKHDQALSEKYKTPVLRDLADRDRTMWLSYILYTPNYFTIWAVKNRAGELIEIGHSKYVDKDFPERNPRPIEKFHFEGINVAVLYAKFKAGADEKEIGSLGVNSITKYLPKKLVLVSADGVDIKEGDTFWWVDKEAYVNSTKANYGYHSNTTIPVFSTKEKAEEHRIMNCPVSVTLHEIKEICFTQDKDGSPSVDSVYRRIANLFAIKQSSK